MDAVYDGEDALTYLETGCYDVAVLDIMMPKMDGITVLKRIRAEGSRIPVLMLTAKSEIEDRVLGLDSGANDYLPKPFDTRELLARIRSISRTRAESDTKLSVGNITLDRASFALSSPTGSVTSISRTGTNEGGNTKFSVTVSLPKQKDLLAGMNASVKITTAETEAAAAIPVNALVEEGSRTYVYTSYDERSDTLGGLVEVETGISDGTLVEIRSGLEAGSVVWYRYADTMNYNFFSMIGGSRP